MDCVRGVLHGYPAQLALASKLAAAGKTGGGTDSQPPVRYTPASDLKPQCSLPYIATEPELDQWLAALRKTAQTELAKGNRISL